MVGIARRNGLPWDAILGSEIAGDYKPKPRVYLAACEAFDLPPAECMMVAAHSKDLSHAAKQGLCTGHVARPNEHGPGKGGRSDGDGGFCCNEPGRPGRETRGVMRINSWSPGQRP
jgi:2-haloacid dehalogenase